MLVLPWCWGGYVVVWGWDGYVVVVTFAPPRDPGGRPPNPNLLFYHKGTHPKFWAKKRKDNFPKKCGWKKNCLFSISKLNIWDCSSEHVVMKKTWNLLQVGWIVVEHRIACTGRHCPNMNIEPVAVGLSPMHHPSSFPSSAQRTGWDAAAYLCND